MQCSIEGGKLLTVTHGVIENGVIAMQGGKITAVGAASSVNVPSAAQVIDVTGMTVYPGLVDSETSLGLTEISAEAMTNDLVELSDEIMPHMHTAEAFHAESALIPVAARTASPMPSSLLKAQTRCPARILSFNSREPPPPRCS